MAASIVERRGKHSSLTLPMAMAYGTPAIRRLIAPKSAFLWGSAACVRRQAIVPPIVLKSHLSLVATASKKVCRLLCPVANPIQQY